MSNGDSYGRSGSNKRRKCSAMNTEAKWIRLQEIGLAQFLALPLAILLAALIGLYSFASACLIILCLGASGYCCLRIGHEKRVELQNKEDISVFHDGKNKFRCRICGDKVDDLAHKIDGNEGVCQECAVAHPYLTGLIAPNTHSGQ